jgi:hypothetical protein
MKAEVEHQRKTVPARVNKPVSLFDRLISRPRPAWLTLLISLAFFALPFIAAYLDGMLVAGFLNGDWRLLLLYPSIIVYILIVSPAMGRRGEEVIAAFRPLVDLDDEAFDKLVNQASYTNPLYEWLAFAIGAGLGILNAQGSGFNENVIWLRLYWFLACAMMYGLLAWTIYVSFASTRLNRVMHSQPLHFDILDPITFEAVGRQSLLLALVFIGGLTLSLVLAFRVEYLTQPLVWLFYLPIIVISVLIFFISMRPTHHAMATEKKRVLTPVQAHLKQACSELVQRLDRGDDAAELPAQINALTIYEQRLLAARTWPYNTAMLRTLFFSVFFPLVTVLGRLLVEVFYR